MNPIEETSTGGWLAVEPLIRAKQDQLAQMHKAAQAADAPNGIKDLSKGYETAPRQAVQESANTAQTEKNKAENGQPDALSKAEEDAETKPSKSGGPHDLTEAEQDTVRKLQARDREVRAHEQAHAAVGGQYAGSPSYTYQSGPDGRQYAVGGEVPIDVSPVKGDPAATIDKMQVVIAAALAPAEPSGQDRKVASLAQSQRAQAFADLSRLRTEERTGEAYDKTL